MKRSLALVLFVVLAAPVFAQETPPQPEFSMGSYMIHELFSPFFKNGSEAVWRLCPPLFAGSAILLVLLLRRKAWSR